MVSSQHRVGPGLPHGANGQQPGTRQVAFNLDLQSEDHSGGVLELSTGSKTRTTPALTCQAHLVRALPFSILETEATAMCQDHVT